MAKGRIKGRKGTGGGRKPARMPGPKGGRGKSARSRNASKAGKASHGKKSNRGRIAYEGDAMGGD